MIGSWDEMPRWKKTAVFRDRPRQSPRDTGFRCRIGGTKVPLEKKFFKKEEASASLFRRLHRANGADRCPSLNQSLFFCVPHAVRRDVAQLIDEGYSS